jgi:hypothetical protein
MRSPSVRPRKTVDRFRSSGSGCEGDSKVKRAVRRVGSGRINGQYDQRRLDVKDEEQLTIEDRESPPLSNLHIDLANETYKRNV